MASFCGCITCFLCIDFFFKKRFSFSFLVTNPFSPLSCRTSQISSYMQNRRMEMGPSFHPATPYMAQITEEARDQNNRRRTGRRSRCNRTLLLGCAVIGSQCFDRHFGCMQICESSKLDTDSTIERVAGFLNTILKHFSFLFFLFFYGG